MAFAEPEDVADQWRSLTERERTRAEALLDLAGIMIRRQVDFSSAVAGDDLYRTAKQVSIDMVIEALAPGVRGGVASYSVQLDGAVESATYRDSGGTSTIVFTQDMRALFGLASAGQSPQGYFGDCPP